MSNGSASELHFGYTSSRLQRFGRSLQTQAAEAFEAQGCKQKLFGELSYAAGSGKRKRRVIHKAEHTDKGANQWRVLLSSLAYVLMDTIRRLALKGTELEKNDRSDDTPEAGQDRCFTPHIRKRGGSKKHAGTGRSCAYK